MRDLVSGVVISLIFLSLDGRAAPRSLEDASRSVNLGARLNDLEELAQDVCRPRKLGRIVNSRDAGAMKLLDRLADVVHSEYGGSWPHEQTLLQPVHIAAQSGVADFYEPCREARSTLEHRKLLSRESWTQKPEVDSGQSPTTRKKTR